MFMLSYYCRILEGYEEESVLFEYDIDIVDSNSDLIRITEKNTKDEIEELSLDEFCKKIKSLYTIFILHYEKGTLFVKRFKSEVTETRKYYLTKKALSNANVVSFMRKLVQNLNYDSNILCEKFCGPLAKLIYEDKEIIIDNSNDLVEFKSFINQSVIRYLCSKLAEKLEERMQPKGLFAFFNPFSKKKVHKKAQAEAQRIVEEKLARTIQENEERLHSTRKKENSEDAFIDNIRKDIIRINESKYDGYRNHLKILYRLAEYYLKMKNLNKTPYELFLGEDNLMGTLVAIEQAIDEATKDQKRMKTNKEILSELAMISGLTSEELTEQDSRDVIEDDIVNDTQGEFEVDCLEFSQTIPIGEGVQLSFKK